MAVKPAACSAAMKLAVLLVVLTMADERDAATSDDDALTLNAIETLSALLCNRRFDAEEEDTAVTVTSLVETPNINASELENCAFCVPPKSTALTPAREITAET